MQTLLVDLILAAAVGVVFLVARRSKNWGYLPRLSGKTGGISAGETALANFFALFWSWADYTRRIGQAPRFNEATVMTADDLKLYTARASGQRPLQKRRSMSAFGGTADRAAASPRPPNKIRQFLQSIFPASRPGKIMGRPVRG